MSLQNVHWTDNDGFSNPGSTSFPSDSDFKSVSDNFDSTFRWAATASIISAVIGAVALVAIVYAIIDCLKKAGNAIPTYARISNNESATPGSDIEAVKVTIEPDFPVISNSQIEGATMERFIRDMANEKPIRFSPQQLEGFTKKYSVLLGSGGYGIVYKGEFPNGEQVAVKILNNDPNKRVNQQFMAEVSTIGRTYHINLVRLYGFCFDPNMIALVYEYMENGSLDNFLFKERETIKWEELHKIAVGTAKGIAYLHEECEKRIIHYDIKPENVLLDANFSPKVADFGLAKLCNRESSHVAMTGCRGTPGYAAPELWKPYPVTHKCDVYSFGMLLFEIVGRRRNHDAEFSETQEWLPRWIWESFDKGQLSEMMELCGIEEINREKAERMSMVAMWCVQYLPEARPLMTTVVKMLEGGQDISAAPNPFQYLESDFFSAVSNGTSGTSTVPSSSSWTTQTSETSLSVPMRSIFEIERS
ncbi:hypothetical protein AQUCO_09600046v1 [Aquilegia coerulea]|uniref:Protein kinase domain-containing protein n=1 Tax=Aquilegia coerulea TaxID=218851 RepID=A0A2G5C4J9_AQUCA|nr:hypothetical protein AQUCO_09600046v1 [Aquilegia coerulea]